MDILCTRSAGVSTHRTQCNRLVIAVLYVLRASIWNAVRHVDLFVSASIYVRIDIPLSPASLMAIEINFRSGRQAPYRDDLA